MSFHRRTTITRRAFARALALPASLWCGTPAAFAKADASRYAHTRLSTDGPIVETTLGRLRGYIRNGTHTFKGVPYAGSTDGEARFKPPRPRTPWAGVREALTFGPVCPQAARVDWIYTPIAFLFDWDDGYQGEDCLSLNIWTPSPDRYRRPVMVWIHGGYYQAGSSHELPSYDGERLSSGKDVVVVSVNHRIGALGHLDLSGIGEDIYEASGNVGLLDLVSALIWIRDNIEQFGGDPNNVTLFGQSGGGYKIGTLMVMPQAHGLFHKAIIQSGSRSRLASRADTAIVAQTVIDELGISKSSLSKLASLPSGEIIAAGIRAQQRLVAGQSRDAKERMRWQPVVDGQIIPNYFAEERGMKLSGDVPLLVGSTMHEWNPSVGDASLSEIDIEKAEDMLRPQLGDYAREVLDVYQRENPKAAPIELLSLVISPRSDVVSQAVLKHATGQAPVFVYWFGWRTPVLQARPLAFHGIDLPFVFDNTDRAASMTGGGERPQLLADKVSTAWSNFARYGNPSHDGLPPWPPFNPGTGATMIFDDTCRVEGDPDRIEREALLAAQRARDLRP